MSFPKVILEDWLKRYPIELRAITCICGKGSIPSRPCMSKEWVGVASDKCSCGHPQPGEVMILRDREAERRLREDIFSV